MKLLSIADVSATYFDLKPNKNGRIKFIGKVSQKKGNILRAIEDGSVADWGYYVPDSQLQDTGWVQVPSARFTNGGICFRRVGNTVYVALSGGEYGSATIDSGSIANSTKIGDIPQGFRTTIPTILWVTADGGATIGNIVLTSINDTSVIQFRNMVGSTSQRRYARTQIASYPTDDPFPENVASLGTIINP